MPARSFILCEQLIESVAQLSSAIYICGIRCKAVAGVWPFCVCFLGFMICPFLYRVFSVNIPLCKCFNKTTSLG